MSLPSVAGKVPLSWPLVPSEVEELLKSEGAFMMPLSECPLTLPRTFTSVDDWISVLDALLTCGLCELVPDSLAPRHVGCRVSAGLFGVPKKGSTQSRLIIDRRAQNSCEVSLKTALAGLYMQGRISLSLSTSRTHSSLHFALCWSVHQDDAFIIL
eukprot:1759175-Amphidinium_carterae.3